MYGGYVKDSLLRTNESGLRTFTQIMDDGSTRGSFTYRDRHDPKMKAYRTPWMPIAHKIFTEKCNSLKIKTKSDQCPPMIIRVMETTLGNNKYNLGKRQRQYYVIQEFYDEPRRIGKITYTYEPKSWFMKWDESPEAFFTRLYSKRDAKRRHLPPIPDIFKGKIASNIKVLENKKGRGKVTIADDVPITAPAPKKGRVKRITKKEMDKAKKIKDLENQIINQTIRTPIRSPQTEPIMARREISERPITPRSVPLKQNKSKSKGSPEIKGVKETIMVPIDGSLYDTQIPIDSKELDILDTLLLQQYPGDSEIIATILLMARIQKDWDYSEFIEEDDILRIDPNNINSETLLEIINELKEPGESFVDFLRSLDVPSYTGPGTFNNYGSEGSEGEGSEEGSEEEGSEGDGSEGSEEDEDGEGSEGSEGTSRFAGEAGQEYLDRYLSSLPTSKSKSKSKRF